MGTKTFIITLALGLTSFTAFAKDKVFPLSVSGTLTVSSPETISVSEGEYRLAYNENCPFFGFGSCKNYQFLFLSEKETLSIPLPGKTFDEQYIKDFSEMDPQRKLPSVYNSQKSLRLDFSMSLSQVKQEYEYTVVPRVCKEVCVEQYNLCDEQDIFKRCPAPEAQHRYCGRYETQCTPSYEVCYLNTEGDAILVVDIFDVLASKPAAKFVSETKKLKRKEQVPMPRCFQQ